ncbi:MAG: hypothetical protein KDD66_06175 [Bdellovibrionales bacterium]|nr:hypothetical protein [Bdellovibrionales bacterium]
MPACSLILIGCGGGWTATGGPKPLVQLPLTTEVSDDFVPLRVNQIAVMPFDGQGINRLPKTQADSVNSSVVQAFQVWTSLELANEKSPDQTQTAISQAGQLAKPLFEKAVALGSSTGAQGVICGTLNIFDESTGSAYGAMGTAHVQFKLWLVDVRSGAPLWTATFNKGDVPLNENLFRLRDAVNKGVKWRGAQQLLQDGLKLAATDLEALRTK